MLLEIVRLITSELYVDFEMASIFVQLLLILNLARHFKVRIQSLSSV